MPIWVALAGTLGWNYARHLQGKSTLCSSTRATLPAVAVDIGLTLGSMVLRRHVINGYARSNRKRSL